MVTKKLIMEKKPQNASPRWDWMFSHQYHKIELTCLKKPMREGNENFKFAYADMHGNLKLILN